MIKLSTSNFWTITGDELVKRWGVDASLIEQFMLDYDLPVRDSKSREIFDFLDDTPENHRYFLTKYITEGPFTRFQFRPSDIESFEAQNGKFPEELKKTRPIETSSSPASRQDTAPLPAQTSAPKLVKLTPVQEAKEDAREEANKYIRVCEKKRVVPSIKEAVGKVKAILAKPYQDNTIRNWIKDLFPDESRKQGRPKISN